MGSLHLNFFFLVREFQETLAAELVLEGKTLLLKMPQTLDTTLAEIKLKLTWETPSQRTNSYSTGRYYAS